MFWIVDKRNNNMFANMLRLNKGRNSSSRPYKLSCNISEY